MAVNRSPVMGARLILPDTTNSMVSAVSTVEHVPIFATIPMHFPVIVGLSRTVPVIFALAGLRIL